MRDACTEFCGAKYFAIKNIGTDNNQSLVCLLAGHSVEADTSPKIPQTNTHTHFSHVGIDLADDLVAEGEGHSNIDLGGLRCVWVAVKGPNLGPTRDKSSGTWEPK